MFTQVDQTNFDVTKSFNLMSDFVYKIVNYLCNLIDS